MRACSPILCLILPRSLTAAANERSVASRSNFHTGYTRLTPPFSRHRAPDSFQTMSPSTTDRESTAQERSPQGPIPLGYGRAPGTRRCAAMVALEVRGTAW